MAFDLSDYVDVRHRLELALLKFPDLRVVENEPQLIPIGERVYIQCEVAVYRDHEDLRPMRAFCWEVFPGRTPYTKDSEQMNGATSALGRALGYMGFGIKSGLASADEVRTAQGNSHPSTEPPREQRPAQPTPIKRQPTGSALTGMATAKQLDLIRDMRNERGLDPYEADGKTYAEASEEITRLKAIPRNG
jgi:hypothetical protein